VAVGHRVGSSTAKIWNNGNEAGQKWKSLTTDCYYQDGSETKEGHSFGRREVAQLVVALKEFPQIIERLPGFGFLGKMALEISLPLFPSKHPLSYIMSKRKHGKQSEI
jgi:hypothetical protein